jgi:hypothetical protein
MPNVVDAKKSSSLRAQRSNLVDSTPSRLQIATSPGGLLAMTGAGGMFMTNLSRLDAIRPLAFSMLLVLLPATSWAQQRPPIAEQMAKTYGLDSFGQIEGIRYTFNAELPGVELSRAWEWNPKTDTVSYEEKDKEGKPVKANYQRSRLASQSEAIKN